ncbi:MAG: GNAT family N-acetyltransferase, partial [Phaeodactylibacter sp.]|nr:GNAT family N-acetyltransferase [Phaeodactylibacter sp.]
KGYGTRMKLFLIERCRELEYHHLVAKIFATNTASIEYNRKLGYEIVGQQREIGFKNGMWMDIVIMSLLLD